MSKVLTNLEPLEKFALEMPGGEKLCGAPIADDLREFPELRSRVRGIAVEADEEHGYVKYYFLLEDGERHSAESLLLLALRHAVDEAEVYYVSSGSSGASTVSALYTKSPVGPPVTGARHTLNRLGKMLGVELVPGNIVVMWEYCGWK